MDISSKLIKRYHEAMKIGQGDSAMISLLQAWRFRLLGGYNLSLILKTFEDRLKLSVSEFTHSWALMLPFTYSRLYWNMYVFFRLSTVNTVQRIWH